MGILKSQSLICLRIASELNEGISIKKVCERFTRHLNKKDFGTDIQAAIIAEQCRGFSDDTAIIVDDSDIVKSKAKCMEGLKKVRDGSTGKHDQLGYDLLNIIAYRDSGDGYEIKPLCSELIARDMEQDSLSQITEDRLIDITLASGNKGVYIFDRGYDRRTLFGFLQQNAMNYIVRSAGARGIIVGGAEKSFIDVAKSVELDHKYVIADSKQTLHCGIKRVSIRLNPHPVKHPDTIDTWMVVARYSPDHKGRSGYFYFFCDFPGQPDLSAEKIIEKAIIMYRMRWKIEEVHRHLKQSYGWEKIQLTSYTRLQNMNQVFLLTMCYLYSLKRFAYKFLLAFPNIMTYTQKDWKTIYDFVYYRLSLLIDKCFSSVSRYNLNPHKGKWHEAKQLIIPCLKNGGM
ncbi:MAG: transposase [Candidatus Subteraquimicrobiales bacterium]|nr:transposase [Candidatus Subteraquimicrobiales bacterium]